MRMAGRNYVLKGKSKRQSLIEAGYSPSYAQTNAKEIFEHPLMLEYLDELEIKQEQRELDLWKEIIADAPRHYRELKALSSATKNDDVKRKILQDLLDRAGFQSSNKLDITQESKISDEQADSEIVMLMKQLKKEGIDVKRFFSKNDD